MRYILTLAVILAGCTCAGEPSGKAWITSVPPGAAIFSVAGDVKTDTGKKTPALLYLPLGAQRVELVLAGYVPATVAVVVDGQAIAKPLTEQLVQAKVSVDVIFEDGDGFAVYCDGKPLKDAKGAAATTPCTVELPAGPHALTLAKDGFLDVAQKIEAKVGMDPLTIKTKPAKGTSTLPQSAPQPAPLRFADCVGKYTTSKFGPWTISLEGKTFVLKEPATSRQSVECLVTERTPLLTRSLIRARSCHG